MVKLIKYFIPGLIIGTLSVGIPLFIINNRLEKKIEDLTIKKQELLLENQKNLELFQKEKEDLFDTHSSEVQRWKSINGSNKTKIEKINSYRSIIISAYDRLFKLQGDFRKAELHPTEETRESGDSKS